MAPVTRSATRASTRVTRSCTGKIQNTKAQKRQYRASLIRTRDTLQRDIKKMEARYQELLKETEYLNSITPDVSKTAVCTVCNQDVLKANFPSQSNTCRACIEDITKCCVICVTEYAESSNGFFDGHDSKIFVSCFNCDRKLCSDHCTIVKDHTFGCNKVGCNKHPSDYTSYRLE